MLRDISVTCLAVFFIGLSYGAIAVASGFPLWLPAAQSVLVLAGASEFLFIGIVAAGGNPIAAALAGLLVCRGLAGVSGAFGSAHAPAARTETTAYVLEHVEGALAPATVDNLISLDRIVFPPAFLRPCGWSRRRDRNRHRRLAVECSSMLVSAYRGTERSPRTAERAARLRCRNLERERFRDADRGDLPHQHLVDGPGNGQRAGSSGCAEGSIHLTSGRATAGPPSSDHSCRAAPIWWPAIRSSTGSTPSR